MTEDDDYEFDDSAFSAEEWYCFGLDDEEYRRELIEEERRREEYEENTNSLLEDISYNNLKSFEIDDFDCQFWFRKNTPVFYESNSIEEFISHISRLYGKNSLTNVLFFVTDKTAEAALAQVSVIEEKLKPYCVENANIFSGCNKTIKEPLIRVMFLDKEHERHYEAEKTDGEFDDIEF